MRKNRDEVDKWEQKEQKKKDDKLVSYRDDEFSNTDK